MLSLLGPWKKDQVCPDPKGQLAVDNTGDIPDMGHMQVLVQTLTQFKHKVRTIYMYREYPNQLKLRALSSFFAWLEFAAEAAKPHARCEVRRPWWFQKSL